VLASSSGDLEIYTDTGSAQSSWRPLVGSVPTTLVRGITYSLSGTQLSGLTEGSGYGDDEDDATNYPLVQIQNNATGTVYFARTSDISSMSVAPGTKSSVNFVMPTNAPTGASSLTVVANGVASASVSVNVATQGPPGSPTDVSAVAGRGQATVSFTPPSNDGGAPINDYLVEATDLTNSANNTAFGGTSSPITLTGLTNGDQYEFQVLAANSYGLGELSAFSNTVEPKGSPVAPTDVTATPGNSWVTVSFTPPSNDGGSPITGYIVQANDLTNPANDTAVGGTSSPITLTGLTNGDQYQFQVLAANALGFGPFSSDSNTVVPAAWSQLSPSSSPSDRYGTISAYDPATGQLVMFGGNSGSTDLDDTWIWNGSNWTAAAPATAPPAREFASMAYDPTKKELLLFGGNGSSGYLDDTWAWNGSNWVKESPAQSPPARELSSMTFDPGTDQLILFGGYNGANLNDTWSFTGGNWVHLSPAESPPVRSGASVAFDPGTGQFVLFGGYGASGPLADTWKWNGTTWTELNPATSPPARSDAATAFDPATGQLLVFGGNPTSGNNLDDTWAWNGTTWAQQSTGVSPPGRANAPMTFDPGTGQLILFGGQPVNGGAALGDTWTWQ
jgi:hypothetical protein